MPARSCLCSREAKHGSDSDSDSDEEEEEQEEEEEEEKSAWAKPAMPANAQTGKVLMEMAWTDKQRLLLAESKVREKGTPATRATARPSGRTNLFSCASR